MRLDKEGEEETSLSYPFLQIPFIDAGDQSREEEIVEGLENERSALVTEDIDNVVGEKTEKNLINVEEIQKEDCKERKDEKIILGDEEKGRLDGGRLTNSEDEEERVNQDELKQQSILRENGKQSEDCVNSQEEGRKQKTVVVLHQPRKIPRVETWCGSSTSKFPSAPLQRSAKAGFPAVSGSGKLSKIGRSSSSPRLREQTR